MVSVALTDTEILMPYWIVENGETIGPLEANEALARARQETLVSSGNKWVRFDEHPAFPRSETAEPIQTAEVVLEVKEPRIPVELGKTPPQTQKSRSPKPTGISSGGRLRFTLIRLLGLLAVLALLAGLVKSVFFTSAIAVTPGQRLSILGEPAQAGPIDAVYSEPLDVIGLQSDVRVNGKESSISVLKTAIKYNVEEGSFTKAQGSTAWANRSSWQKMARSFQREMLENLAAVSCGCVEPEHWYSEIRDSQTDIVLAAISPNGLRALWTTEGYSPEVAPVGSIADTMSDASASENSQFLIERLQQIKKMISPASRINGTLSGSIEQVVDGSRINTIVVNGTAAPLYDISAAPSFNRPTELLVLLGNDPSVPDGRGTPYNNVHYFAAIVEVDGSSFPMYLLGLPEATLAKYVEEYRSLTNRLRVLESALISTGSDIELHKYLTVATSKLGKLRSEYQQLDFSIPRFVVHGRIIDHRENIVALHGGATPNNGDWNHTGSVHPSSPKTLAVHTEEGIQNPINFFGEDLFFLQIDVNGYRHYSSTPPAAAREARAKASALLDEIAKVRERIAPIQEEIVRRKNKQREIEWAAVQDSVPDLSDYAEKKLAQGETDEARRACNRIEEIGTADGFLLFFCGDVCEQMNDRDSAIRWYEKTILAEPDHRTANRKVAFFLSQQSDDPFIQTPHLMKYLEYSDNSEIEYNNVMIDLQAHMESWSDRGLSFLECRDTARMGQVHVRTTVHRDYISRQIENLEKKSQSCNADFESLRSQLQGLGLDLESMMRHSKDHMGTENLVRTLETKIDTAKNAPSSSRRSSLGLGSTADAISDYSEILRDVRTRFPEDHGVDSPVSSPQDLDRSNGSTVVDPLEGDNQRTSTTGSPSKSPASTGRTVYLPAGQSVADDMPSWVPVYPPGTAVNPHYMGMGEVFVGGFEIRSSDPLFDVLEFYKESLRREGFAVDIEPASPSGGGDRTIKARSNSDRRKIEVALTEQGSVTIAVVTYSKGK